MNLPTEIIRCPVHGIPDCSALLNGCSMPFYLSKVYKQGFDDGYSEALTDTFHPEFGTAWREPDGECYKAYQAGKNDR